MPGQRRKPEANEGSPPGGRLTPDEFWRGLYSLIATSTGWTFRHIDQELTLPEAMDLVTYWSDFPPQHILLRAWVGYESPTPAKAERLEDMNDEDRDAALEGLFRALGG